MTAPSTLCIVLKYLRQSRHCTQKEISHVLHVSVQAYSHYETGKRIPSYSTLEQLSQYYHSSYPLLLEAAFHGVLTADAFILLDQANHLTETDRIELLSYAKLKSESVSPPHAS